MFGSIDPRLFWPAFVLFWLLAVFAAIYAFGKFVDAGNPMRRTRRNIAGRKAMATDWRKPSHLPDDWQ